MQFSWRVPLNSYCGLPDRQCVADDDAVLVRIAGEVGFEAGVAQAHVDIFQWPALHHVLDLDIALPLAAGVISAGNLRVAAFDVAGHKAQAGYAELAEVVVVAGLPGALVGVGEVVDLHEVDQERVAAIDIGVTGVAAHVLKAQAEFVAVDRVAEHGVEGAVVDLAGIGCAAVVAQHHPYIGAQGAAAQRLAGEQAEEVLAIDIVEVGEVVAAFELLVEAVVEAHQIEMVGGNASGKAAVLAVEDQLLGVGRGAVDYFVQATTGKGQAVDFAGGQQAAFEYLRQQAAVAGLDHRQLRDVRTIAQLGIGDLDLSGQAQAAKLIRSAAIVLYR